MGSEMCIRDSLPGVDVGAVGCALCAELGECCIELHRPRGCSPLHTPRGSCGGTPVGADDAPADQSPIGPRTPELPAPHACAARVREG